MIKVKKIYICDHCNNLALYETYPDGSECLPTGWKRLGLKKHLCPSCTIVWKHFEKSGDKENKNGF